jgi:predicted amidohydrolase YtcJ
MADHKKKELVRFLEQRAFKPVLKAKPSGRSEADRKRLEHVQKATEAEIERFHNYGSAEEVVTNFRRDLDSVPAKRVHAELRSLGLPTIHDIRDEFEERAQKLGVRNCA